MIVRSLAVVLAVCACASPDGDPDVCAGELVGTRCVTAELAACLRQEPSIAQGFYGCVAEQPDVGNPLPPAHPVPAFRVNAFAPDGSGAILGSAETSPSGFFEIALTEGQIALLPTSPVSESIFMIPTGTIAIDLTITAGSFWRRR